MQEPLAAGASCAPVQCQSVRINDDSEIFRFRCKRWHNGLEGARELYRRRICLHAFDTMRLACFEEFGLVVAADENALLITPLNLSQAA
jgi:hypothetical protein